MQYIFKTSDTWHVYEKKEGAWIYQKMQMVSEEIVNKEGEALPGPLERLDSIQELEEKLQQERQYAKQQETLRKQQEQEWHKRQQELEHAYAQLQNMAEELQEEGRMWRQRYLDLAYQVSPKGK